jgi:hypothetical protein
MASSLVHLAIIEELTKGHKFKDIGRLKFGAVLPDAGERNIGHLKITVPPTYMRTYDFEGFRNRYGSLLMTDDLYLGYYLHLVQDLCYRHFVYDRYHWNPMIPGNVEKLHNDYAITNHYVVEKYNLKNDLAVPEDFAEEKINEICRFDLLWLTRSINSYFREAGEGEIFFFTKEMTDEFIAEAVDACQKELNALKTGIGMINGSENGWVPTYTASK